ncbi:MAG: hypothetical protein MRK01_10510 [Candidatus Scalindua sp.]|nr:hypothetical protein [Candidatus Scalindua sp.]
MPKMKQMIKRSEIQIAKALRTCKFTKQPILKGSICLVLYEGPRDRFCYSQETALEMIKQARTLLNELENDLTS